MYYQSGKINTFDNTSVEIHATQKKNSTYTENLLSTQQIYGVCLTMAPAAADTIVTHLQDLERAPDYYDVIVTGDLGEIGSSLCQKMTKDNGYDIKERHRDCGLLLFDVEKQDVHSGGSGCGCAASVFSGYFMKKLEQREIKRMLFLATGALFSPTSQMQGESIPGIAHALSICIN